MKLNRAELKMNDERSAIYDGGGVFVTTDFKGPVLMLAVDDFEEAQAILQTLDRSFARKKSTTSPPAPAAAPAIPPSGNAAGRAKESVPHCIAPGCTFDAEKDGTCRDHAGATEAEKETWRRAQQVTPPSEAKKRARGIREHIEGGGEKGEPGKVA